MMASTNSKTKEKQETTTWDSDIEVSSDDNKTSDNDDKPTKTKAKTPKPPPYNDVTNPDPKEKEKEIEKKKPNDPSHLKLSLLDNYTHSKMYNKIRKRRVQKKLNNNDLNDTNDMNNIKIEKPDSLAPQKKLTINDLKSHRILYEMNSYQYKWYWIDSLPTDDSNDYEWINQYSNINLFKEIKDEKKQENDVLQYRDIAQEINNNNLIQVISVSDFDHNLNEFRKSVINSPLFPELGCRGYCKEFYVTLCDWNAEGVLSIKYISDESQRQISESKSLKTCNGYWQKLRYQISVSDNGKYIAILFDRYCIIRSYKNNFYADLYNIKLPFSFWQYTQFRFIKWSKNNELLAISSYNANIIIYDNKCNQILAFNNNNRHNNANISGLTWRKYITDKKDQSNYHLELIILFNNGELHRRSFEMNGTSFEVLNFDKQTQISTVQYPHRRICKWIYDGIDYYDGKNEYMAISCLPVKLLDTKPRQSRLGHGIMLLQFEDMNCRVIAHYNSRIPSNSYFSVDSVCFTMADRRAKLYGRHVHISGDGKHVLCVDLRGNMELFDANLQLLAKIGNTREMSYGSYPSQSRVYCMKWWDNESIIILFCNNTFCITPLISIKHYNQRDMKWSLNYLGQSREQLYGLPILSNTVPIAGEEEVENKMFFILEISEAYLRRTDDEHLKYIVPVSNDIDRKQNEIYGYRKYRNISLSTFSSITAVQLFEKYLKNDEYDKALQIADMFKLNTDKAYQSQFNFLINQYNNNNNQQEEGQQNNNNNDGNTEMKNNLFEILEKIDDELWIIDTLLSVSICDFHILDGLLYYGIGLLENSERLRDLRPHGFVQFLKYRERAMSLKCIIEEISYACFGYNYVTFRDANIIEIGYELASKDLLAALVVIFKYHSHEIEKEDRLRILSYIPLSIHPSLYFNILPCTDGPIWETDRWFAKEFGLSTDDDEKNDMLDREQIVNWYKKRIYDIEKMTGNVENALILCNFAVSDKKIVELKCLLEVLLLFHKIVYEYNVDSNISLLEFESMDSARKLLFVLRNSDYKNIINHIHERAEYFVSERDLSLILLDLCPKLSENGKIELVAAILDNHQEFDLLTVIKSYFMKENKESTAEIKQDEVNDDDWDEFEDNFSDNEPNESTVDKYDGMTESDLLIEYALLNALKCTNDNCWEGLDKLLLAINNIQKEKNERITQFTAFINGGAQLAKSYNIHRSLIFYSTLFNIGHITKKIDNSNNNNNINKENILKWKDILNVSDHQLSNYESLNLLLTRQKPVVNDTVITTLHNLAIDITTDLFRGIQQKARKFVNDEEWEKLREDLLNFQHQLFSFISLDTIQFEFMRIMFECCSFSFISKTMKCENPPISNENLIELSLKTASELIDASISFESVTLIEAQNCLSIIPKKFRNSEFWKLWDLISAVKLLHDEFNCDVIPFQLKNLFILKNNKYFTDKQRAFIINILECNTAKNYLKKDYLISVIEYLSFDNENINEYKIELLCILSDYALQQMDKHFKSTNQISIKSGLECQLFSYNIYLEIFDKNYIKKTKKYPKYIMSLLWNICSKLMESTQHPNNINNLQLLSHSLTASSNNKIYTILKLWQSVNSKDNYHNIIHSIAVSLRKRKGDYVSDSDDSDDNINGNNDWNEFIQDIETRPVLYTKMTKQEIKNEINMNEMEKMVHLYFNTDPDVLSSYRNDEIYSFISKTNKYWKKLDVLSNALIPCSNINMLLQPSKIENFEILILKIIENIYLCDKIQLITFLLLIEDINIMNKSFIAVLAHKNIPKNKKIDIIQIAIKYFMYQTINKFQQYYEYNENQYIEHDETDQYQMIFDMIPANVADIFFMEIINDTTDEDIDDDDHHCKITIKDLLKCKQLSSINDEDVRKCYSKSIYFYDKWCKWTKHN